MSIILKLIIICLILLFILYIGYTLIMNLDISVNWTTILVILMFCLFIKYINEYSVTSKTMYFILSILFYCIFIYLVYTNDYLNVTAGQAPWVIIAFISSVFILIGGGLFAEYKYLSIIIFMLIGIILFFYFILKYLIDFFIYLSDPSNTITIETVLKYIGISLLILVILGILYYVYSMKFTSNEAYLNTLKLWWNYLYHFVWDIIVYLEILYEDTDGYEILALLFCTVITILLLFYKQLYRSFIRWNDGKYLITSPIILSEETTLNYKPQFQYQYAISAWIWFNSTHSTNHTVPILNYGDCPIIEYDTETNKINIIFLNQSKVKTKIVSTKVQMQKWNHVVINNVGGTVDVFINGTLIKTVENVVPIQSVKNITVGSNGGISGGLSNLMYFTTPLTIHQIHEIYSYTPKY
jgi:Concanavalin A-like lectin/glucanases superfamily